LAAGTALIRNPASRFTFIRQAASSVILFADGHCYMCTDDAADFAQTIGVEALRAAVSSYSAAALDLIAALFNAGSLAFDLDG